MLHPLKFMEILKSWDQYDKLHGYIHPQARVGANYLRKMGDSYFD